jgi:hypothetical protein
MYNTLGLAFRIDANSLNIFNGGNLAVTGSITCTSVSQTSDERVKTNIKPASLDAVQQVFNAVQVQTYTRTDGVDGSRIGFIAQHMEAALEDTGFDNIMGTTRKHTPPEAPECEEPEPGEELLTIDHSRLVAILWGVCKNQQKQLQELTARVALLE